MRSIGAAPFAVPPAKVVGLRLVILGRVEEEVRQGCSRTRVRRRGGGHRKRYRGPAASSRKTQPTVQEGEDELRKSVLSWAVKQGAEVKAEV